MIKDPYGGWMFDLDEREALTDILKAKFDSKQIDTFLELLQFICFQMKIWNEELLSYQDVKGYADPILNSIKKTTDYLSLLEKEQLAQGIPFCIGLYWFSVNWNFPCFELVLNDNPNRRIKWVRTERAIRLRRK